jgi:enolase-phosphatase E1
MQFNDISAILLDIEGTTTPISFVHDVLFPYSRNNLSSYLKQHANSPELLRDLTLLDQEHAVDVNEDKHPPPLVEPYLHWLIEQNRKSPALKSIQGKIWKQGYVDGSLKAPLFPDVLPAMNRWRDQKIQIAIFSSGSILAQKLLFQHTDVGDVTEYIQGFFDTSVGKKIESKSYRRIATELELPPNQILFVSDVTKELEAANAASMNTLLCLRPGNPLQAEHDRFPSITTFSEIQ